MLIIDTETTGLHGYPRDRVLEIGIAELNEETLKVEPVYNALIRYRDQDAFFADYRKKCGPIWIFDHTDLTPEEIAEKGKDIDQVVADVRSIVDGRDVTSYNVPFDFGSFLDFDPWNLSEICKVPFDIMDEATFTVRNRADHGKIENKALADRLLWEWEDFPEKWLRSADAYAALCPEDPARIGEQKHRALDDAIQEAYILAAIRRGCRWPMCIASSSNSTENTAPSLASTRTWGPR